MASSSFPAGMQPGFPAINGLPPSRRTYIVRVIDGSDLEVPALPHELWLNVIDELSDGLNDSALAMLGRCSHAFHLLTKSQLRKNAVAYRDLSAIHYVASSLYPHPLPTLSPDEGHEGAPLFYAAYRGNAAHIKYLIEGTCYSSTEELHETMALAITWTHSAIVEVLLDAGLDANGSYERTQHLERAVSVYDTQKEALHIIQLLLDHGADYSEQYLSVFVAWLKLTSRGRKSLPLLQAFSQQHIKLLVEDELDIPVRELNMFDAPDVPVELEGHPLPMDWGF